MRSFAVPGAIALITVLVLLPLVVSPRKGEADPTQQAPAATAAQNPAPSSGKVYGEWFIRVKPDKGAEYSQLIQEKGLILFRDAGGRVGRRGEYLRFMERAVPLLQKHGFRPVGPFETGVGRWSQVTYLFRYESLAERDQLMAAFAAQPYGVTYSVRIGELVDDIQNRILVPAPFVK